MSNLDDLRARIDKAPHTERTRQARNYLRLAETHLKLVQIMLDHGLEDRPKPCKPTWSELLRTGLESGTFKPANAAALLDDLTRARAGNCEAKERVISYLESPGVLEALDDG